LRLATFFPFLLLCLAATLIGWPEGNSSASGFALKTRVGAALKFYFKNKISFQITTNITAMKEEQKQE
jgi:hypothetical protein